MHDFHSLVCHKCREFIPCEQTALCSILFCPFSITMQSTEQFPCTERYFPAVFLTKWSTFLLGNLGRCYKGRGGTTGILTGELKYYQYTSWFRVCALKFQQANSLLGEKDGCRYFSSVLMIDKRIQRDPIKKLTWWLYTSSSLYHIQLVLASMNRSYWHWRNSVWDHEQRIKMNEKLTTCISATFQTAQTPEL